MHRVGLIGVIVAIVGCPPSEPAQIARDEAVDVPGTIRVVCQRHADAVAKAHAAGRREEHAALSAGMVRMMRRLPLAVLRPCEDVLVERVRSGGAAVHATVLIEHGYRLARAANRANDRRYRVLARAIRRTNAKPAKPDARAVVAIRTMTDDGFRAYSQNVGAVALALTYSSFGRAQYAQGARPEHLVRLFELFRECREAEKSEEALKAKQAERCDVLAKEIVDALPELGPQSPGDLVAGIEAGIGRGIGACLGSIANDATAEMIESVEQYAECRRDEAANRGTQSAIGPSGFMDGTVASGSTSSSGSSPAPAAPESVSENLRGATLVGSSYDETGGPGGFGAQETYEYERPDGRGGTEKITVSNWSTQTTDANGQTTEQSGTYVQIENSEGTSQHSYVNENGGQRLTSSSWESAEGNASYSAEYNANGTLSDEVIIDEDGEVTHNTYDENGDLEKSETSNLNDDTGGTQPSSTTQPPDDMMASACGGALFERPDRERFSGGPGGRLGPWIIPDPDAAPAGIFDACLTAMAADNAPPRCPPSVATCVEDVTTGCGCGTPTGGGPLPEGNPGYIDCGPDSTYDPATGTCRGAGGGGFPGVLDLGPTPPERGTGGGGSGIKLGNATPRAIRSAVPNAGKLWFPPAGDSSLEDILGPRPGGSGPRSGSSAGAGSSSATPPP